jgi:hypothetical protein
LTRLVALIGLLAASGLGASGCSGAAPTPAQAPAPASASWQKPGADGQTISRDTFACRTEAQATALRRYPYSADSPTLGAGGMIASQQHDDTNRATVEAARFNECMLERGYKRG